MKTLANNTQGWIQFVVEPDHSLSGRWGRWMSAVLLLLGSLVAAGKGWGLWRTVEEFSPQSFALQKGSYLVLPVAVLLWWRSRTTVCRDSVTVLEGVGLQVASEGAKGQIDVRLLEWPAIREVLIVEGAWRFQYIFYMVVRLTDPKASTVVLFPVLVREEESGLSYSSAHAPL